MSICYHPWRYGEDQLGGLAYVASKKRSSVSKTHIDKRRDAVKTMCYNQAPLLKCNISIADCMAPSSILKTIKIDGSVECRCVWKNGDSQQISGLSLLDRHHMGDRLSLYHVSDDGGGSIHNIHCSVQQAREPATVGAKQETTEAWRCSPRFRGHDYNKRRQYAEDKLCKKYYFWPPYLETVKDAPTKVEKPTYGTHFHADRHDIFPYRGLPWAIRAYHLMLYIFRKLSSS